MKSFKILIPLLLFVFTTIGCSPGPKVDAKNKETLEASIKALKKELDFVQQLNFEQAMAIILMENVDNIFKLKFDEKFYKNLQDKIDGKNYNQIVNLAVEITEKKIVQLEKSKDKDSENRSLIEKVLIKKFILDTNFYNPILFFELENKTNLHFTGAKFEIEILNPEDDEPVASTQFMVDFNGVLFANYSAQFRENLPKDFATEEKDLKQNFKIIGLYGQNFQNELTFTSEDQRLLDKFKQFVNKNK